MVCGKNVLGAGNGQGEVWEPEKAHYILEQKEDQEEPSGERWEVRSGQKPSPRGGLAVSGKGWEPPRVVQLEEEA